MPPSYALFLPRTLPYRSTAPSLHRLLEGIQKPCQRDGRRLFPPAIARGTTSPVGPTPMPALCTHAACCFNVSSYCMLRTVHIRSSKFHVKAVHRGPTFSQVAGTRQSSIHPPTHLHLCGPPEPQIPTECIGRWNGSSVRSREAHIDCPHEQWFYLDVAFFVSHNMLAFPIAFLSSLYHYTVLIVVGGGRAADRLLIAHPRGISARCRSPSVLTPAPSSL
ncbi:hypothetical protein BU24DRAFT_85529 [Aaosphaeria arxii CBS 175.79]|uniref:Uncharacterized protein n=1 Tax=Aaosphaeria arxii CBS 175.79 TaxID=1450172 RepID=A0A6A5X8F6_9PLEO|nr:uncharacterized protein BU24DRAFT_85529 [Aaosphaeria arxii CBS 175.79]KAF2009238.1 hypothetical protein BU24DRAFT_85529 [Aaosphaeria arxii CBS 175.79]